MDLDQLQRFKDQLIALRDEATQAGDVAIEPMNDDPWDRADPDDDLPLNEMNQIIASERNRARTGSLEQIHAALKRIEDDPDEFGVCLTCDEDIDPRRLELMPWTTICVRCLSAREQEGSLRRGRRKHLLDF